MSLRADKRQWVIYQEPSVAAAVRAVEVLCMMLAGAGLANHEAIELRAIGNSAERMADARLRFMLGLIKDNEPTDEERQAGEHLVLVYDWIKGGAKPDQATDELWAALYWLDEQAMAGGVSGDGFVREIVKGLR
jgi:hypothetical protein